ncbi:Cysteine rich receptor like kinase [Trema orientale]|uniref:Cysteine rich receptor like kinase n=1 Tax=Trema orientale TaxID=63057 RepID=A0A2P5EIF4_TREOI|nr:Cysteine rich receptor like kinase [Trema orientale]
MARIQCVLKPNLPLILLYFLHITIFWDLTRSFPDSPPYQLCLNTTSYADNSSFQMNLNNLLQILPSSAASSKFNTTSIGNDTDQVYGLYMCFNYVSDETCRYCITSASQAINTLCLYSKEAVIWEEYCQLRYSNDNFFGNLNVSDNLPLANVQSIDDPGSFSSVVNETLRNLTNSAAYNLSAKFYATGEAPYEDKTIYSLVQCTGDLSSDECDECLKRAIEDVLHKFNYSIGARLYSRSCFLRYELYPFYRNGSDPLPSPPDNGNQEDMGRKIWTITILTVGAACLVIVLFGSGAYYLAYNKRKKRRNDKTPEQTMMRKRRFRRSDPRAQEYPHIDLASLNAATNYFSDANKLGQGGFGPVYKGLLKDGREVAVKRLSIGSEQGSEEFTNEVLLIMKLQHTNLVRLLGFCVDGEEKLLVYEYMPNNSLDVALFDQRMRAKLNWSTRLKIIDGIARGILYLHEDSRLRIIHRDLKASNILLDFDMNPKISDFGMARIFAGSEGEANTATIVGTYGYMAPEYAMEGLYSVKSDVYSFGVLLIEIITGKRNAGFHQTNCASSLVAYAWLLWNEEQVAELMDPLAADSCDTDEFLRYLHIGLLCVQEDAYDRPSMSSVVVMLKSESTTLCQPKRAAFSTGRFAGRCESVVDSSSVNEVTVSDVMPR